MRIQHNITAMNAHRNYGINNGAIAKSVEKLSSGYRINRAGDDAAGLAISEKMRAQIRGLNMASKNSQDAISLVQTAEGALQSTHDILQRMRELSVQSASDTNEQVIDRGALQQEFEQLKSEINEIASKTRFNDQNLIDGTFSKYMVQMGGDASAVTLSTTTKIRVSATGKDYGTFTFSTAGIAATTASTTGGTAATVSAGLTTMTGAAVSAVSYVGQNTSAYNNNTYTIKVADQGDNTMIFTVADSDGNTVATSAAIDLNTWANASTAAVPRTVSIGEFGSFTFTINATQDAEAIKSDLLGSTINGAQISMTNVGGDAVKTAAKPATTTLTLNGESMDVKLGDTSVTFRNSGVTLYFDGGIRDADLGAAGIAAGLSNKNVVISALKGNSLTIQCGANQGDEIAINLDKMNTVALGIDGSSITNRLSASRAITEVNDALNAVSTQRAALGALQNRLEFKIANLDTSAENLQAAEGRIRDVDMAKEMTEFTKKNILSQASTAMLAQANALPQGVLQLLG